VQIPAGPQTRPGDSEERFIGTSESDVRCAWAIGPGTRARPGSRHRSLHLPSAAGRRARVGSRERRKLFTRSDSPGVGGPTEQSQLSSDFTRATRTSLNVPAPPGRQSTRLRRSSDVRLSRRNDRTGLARQGASTGTPDQVSLVAGTDVSPPACSSAIAGTGSGS
jgi:hypothetical protein